MLQARLQVSQCCLKWYNAPFINIPSLRKRVLSERGGMSCFSLGAEQTECAALCYTFQLLEAWHMRTHKILNTFILMSDWHTLHKSMWHRP